jgi:hypothetical protein
VQQLFYLAVVAVYYRYFAGRGACCYQSFYLQGNVNQFLAWVFVFQYYRLNNLAVKTRVRCLQVFIEPSWAVKALVVVIDERPEISSICWLER